MGSINSSMPQALNDLLDTFTPWSLIDKPKKEVTVS